MKKFTYVITDKAGIHARPAGTVVKKAKGFESSITVRLGEKEADAANLLALMSMGIKYGDEITVEAEGADEEAACAAMEEVLKEKL